jgi:Domain of unknown function (DUF1772)
MIELWTVAMMVSGGLFAGGLVSIAWERVPAWRTERVSNFRQGFAHTLRRVDRLQPALLTICIVSAIGFALTAGGTARFLAFLAAAGFVLILIGSVTWLVPIQRTLKGGDVPGPEVQRLRARWLRGHVVRTAAGLALFVLAAVASTV